MESDDDQMVGTETVRARYGDRCARTIDRWIIDREMGFPKPTMIKKRRFWRLGDLRQWERRQAVRSVA
jgi:hypothetical protein